MFKLTRRFFVALLLWRAVISAGAHEPFDCSSRLMVISNAVRIEVTMGMDGVHQVLPAAGYSPAEFKNIVLPRRAGEAIDLPVEFSVRLFEVNLGENDLTAHAVKVHCDGTEVYFVASYSRPLEGVLKLRAAYFDVATVLRAGTFIATDESGHRLGWTLLSSDNPYTQIQLPSLASNAQAGSITTNASAETLASQELTIQAEPRSWRNTFAQFFKLGVEHILLGFDHLVFLAALLIGARQPKATFWIVTSFTLAHSVTLALAALNLVVISSRIIEPLIAASIIAVGIENLVRPNAATDRYWLAGGFGLLHGFGFAGALREAGLGQGGGAMAVSLFSFNAGVEVGQLAVVAVFLPMLFALRRLKVFERHGTPAMSGVVIILGGFWMIQRLAA
jgi:hydrogenase/urease accessory protein HupE